jgi:hypothetical protein
VNTHNRKYRSRMTMEAPNTGKNVIEKPKAKDLIGYKVIQH